MNDRDCDNCAHHSEGGCSVWECSFEQKEDDKISRQAAIDAICGECQANCIPCEYFPCGEIKAVQALPSAHPTQTDTSNTLKALDCVERQAAIDALDRIFDRCEEIEAHLPEGDPDRTGYKMFPDYMTVWKYLHQLPSAQPEIVRCKECKYAHITYGGEVKYCDIWFPDESHYIDTDNYCSFAERRTDE